ncbi:MAG TPA: LysR family transcriptional regulator [Opitutaceae bacterium]|nr:LysR family transcriptional regulator [Opitutaceae bacterium]
MNIHHLELFYYVARHGGISRAVRHIPYGIQQPAVSSQILLLEEGLGAKLFERSPFRLTTEGGELYAFVRPFFENLDAVEARLRKRAAPIVRIGASELVLREYLPSVMQLLRQKYPQVRLSLQSGFTPQLEAWLLDRQIDLAVTPLDKRPPKRLSCLRLLRVPLVLLVQRQAKIRSAAELWAPGRITEPLITLPADETISRVFKKGLRRLGIEWPATIEASSLDIVTQYVANGQGVGVNVNLAGVSRHAQVRILPLDGFDPIEVAALWHGQPAPLVRVLLEEGQRLVKQLWPQWQCDDTLQ